MHRKYLCKNWHKKYTASICLYFTSNIISRIFIISYNFIASQFVFYAIRALYIFITFERFNSDIWNQKERVLTDQNEPLTFKETYVDIKKRTYITNNYTIVK